MRFTLSSTILLLGLVIWQGSAMAQEEHQHSAGMSHKQAMQKHMPEKTPEPNFKATEAGQGAFATIAEIVSILNKDPSTDWSKVNINALQTHLVDMHEVTLNSLVSTALTADSVVFTVKGAGRTIIAIQNMVTAHANVLSKTTAWEATVEAIDRGVILTMTSSQSGELEKLKALGFYGVMATGAHHQAHHLLMAKGHTDVHAH
jgi:hypothetical protein